MKTVSVHIEGISPLLMNAFPMMVVEGLEKREPGEQAEMKTYRDPESHMLYIPSVCLQRALIAGAQYSKGKGRGSLAKTAAACIYVSPERLDLGVTEYVIDTRPVVVPATKGRILRHRPRLDKWACTAMLEYDEVLLSVTQLRQIVDNTGSRVGVLDFRPEKRGPFGRFMVIGWKTG